MNYGSAAGPGSTITTITTTTSTTDRQQQPVEKRTQETPTSAATRQPQHSSHSSSGGGGGDDNYAGGSGWSNQHRIREHHSSSCKKDTRLRRRARRSAGSLFIAPIPARHASPGTTLCLRALKVRLSLPLPSTASAVCCVVTCGLRLCPLVRSGCCDVVPGKRRDSAPYIYTNEWMGCCRSIGNLRKFGPNCSLMSDRSFPAVFGQTLPSKFVRGNCLIEFSFLFLIITNARLPF